MPIERQTPRRITPIDRKMKRLIETIAWAKFDALVKGTQIALLNKNN
jgi:hypothetical protein